MSDMNHIARKFKIVVVFGRVIVYSNRVSAQLLRDLLRVCMPKATIEIVKDDSFSSKFLILSCDFV